MSTSVGKRIGEALILSVYLAVDAFDVWPKSHVGCLVLAFTGVLGILLLDGFLERSFPVKRVIVLCLIAFAACVLVYFIAPIIAEAPQSSVVATGPTPIGPASPGAPRTFQGGPGIPFEDAEVRGSLKPANEPTPPNGCDRAAIGADALKVLIGDNAITHDGFGAFTAIGIGACEAISMVRKANGIFVNASLYDQERQAVVLTTKLRRLPVRITLRGKAATKAD